MKVVGCPAGGGGGIERSLAADGGDGFWPRNGNGVSDCAAACWKVRATAVASKYRHCVGGVGGKAVEGVKEGIAPGAAQGAVTTEGLVTGVDGTLVTGGIGIFLAGVDEI